MKTVDRILKSITTLPAFPATGNKVAQLLSKPDYSVAEIANVIKLDPSITANILKMANSVYFGTRQKISTINDAVVHLGQKNLLRAIQTAGVSKYYKKGAGGYYDKATDLGTFGSGGFNVADYFEENNGRGRYDSLYRRPPS